MYSSCKSRNAMFFVEQDHVAPKIMMRTASNRTFYICSSVGCVFNDDPVHTARYIALLMNQDALYREIMTEIVASDIPLALRDKVGALLLERLQLDADVEAEDRQK